MQGETIIRILAQQFAVKVLVATLIGFLIPHAGLADRTDLLKEPLLAVFVLVVLCPPSRPCSSRRLQLKFSALCAGLEGFSSFWARYLLLHCTSSAG